MKTPRITWALLLGTIPVLLGVWMTRCSRQPDEVAPLRTSSTGTRPGAALASAPTGPHGAKPRPTAPATGPPTEHTPEELGFFILKRCEGSNIGIRQALKLLHEAYQDACFFSGEKPLPLKFTVRDDPGRMIGFSLDHQSMLHSLNHLAFLAGLKVRRAENDFELYADSSPPPPITADKFHRTYRTAGVMKMLGEMNFPDRGDITDRLRAAGLVRDSLTTVVVDAPGSVTINGCAEDLDSVCDWLDLAAPKLSELRITTKFISSPEPLDLPDAPISNADLQALLRSLATTKGVDLMTTPTLTLRDDEVASLAIPSASGQPRWQSYQAERVGLKIKTTVGNGPPPATPIPAHDQLAGESYLLRDGETLLIQLRDDSHGTAQYLYKLVSAQHFDAPPGHAADSIDKPPPDTPHRPDP